MILSVNHLSFSFGATNILEDIHFHLHEYSKVAIVGVNGAGKTTLLKLLSGELAPDTGEIYRKRHKTIGYLTQMSTLDEKSTILNEFTKVFAPEIQLERELRLEETKMKDLTGTGLAKAMEDYSLLTANFEQSKGYQYRNLVERMIYNLGLVDIQDAPIAQFSGGQKSRIALGKLLLSAPDILLLDEPTNHLDIENIEWLEDTFIKNYPGTIILVSHDRYFVNKTVDHLIEIEYGKSRTFTGSYDEYAIQKEIDREVELNHFLNQQKEIKRQESMIRDYYARATETQIKRAKSKQKMLDKMERIEGPEHAPRSIRLSIKLKQQSGKDVLFLRDVSKSFGKTILFKQVNLHIRRGEKIALIGENGVGKTTLFQAILGDSKGITGEVSLGSQVDIGYFDQTYKELNETNTIYDELIYTHTKRTPLEIRTALASFGFTGEDVFKEIAVLSGGEKGRVALCKLILSNANFLLLDEPTNHLDMESQEILGAALLDYPGTILFISHDRYFINHLADSIVALTPEKSTEYIGDYDYYLSKRAPEILEDKKDIQDGRLHWEAQKAKEAKRRKEDNELIQVEKDIEKLEITLERLEKLLHQESIYQDHVKALEVSTEKEATKEAAKALYKTWENLSLSIEKREAE